MVPGWTPWGLLAGLLWDAGHCALPGHVLLHQMRAIAQLDEVMVRLAAELAPLRPIHLVALLEVQAAQRADARGGGRRCDVSATQQ